MDEFWLPAEQFAKIRPHLPTDTRGKVRADDRRVISGIIHVLKSHGRGSDAPRGRVDASVRDARTSGRASLKDARRLLGREGASLRLGRKSGEQTQAIGRSRSGRTNKIHALTDRICRPIAFLPTGGQVADCKAAATLLERLPAC